MKQKWNCDKKADAAVDRHDWEIGLARHHAFLQKHPTNCLAIYHLGYIYGKLGNKIKEVNHYEKAVQCGLDTDDLLFFNLGMAYGELNSMDKSLDAFERAIAINPKNPENYFGMGLIAQADGQTEKAQSTFLRTIAVDPHHWEARIALSHIYLEEGLLKSARNQLDILRESIPRNEEVIELWQIYQDRNMTTYEPSSK